jgi:hypothetical protein
LTAEAQHRRPLVGIGLPVYNGEKYLRGCLDSLLGQDYADIELTVSDNASTDATEAICREYAARDRRVRYHRAERNMGAVWNFRRAFELSRGEYFCWAAFDDLREPSFVRRCVEALEASPRAVMCCPGVRLIDEEGREIGEREFTHGIRPAGATARERLSAIARATYWYDFYGVMRRSALARTRLPQPVWGFDVLLVAEMCLLGPVVTVPERLLVYRIFWKKSGQDAAATLGAAEAPKSEGGAKAEGEVETKGGAKAEGGAKAAAGAAAAAASPAIPVSWGALAREIAGAVMRSGLPRAERARLAARFLYEFCLRNPLVREGLRGESVARALGAWREGRYAPPAGHASLAGLLSSVGLAERALAALRRRALGARHRGAPL